MDYIGVDDPAAEVAFISTYLLPHMDEDPEVVVEEYVLDGAVTSDIV